MPTKKATGSKTSSIRKAVTDNLHDMVENGKEKLKEEIIFLSDTMVKKLGGAKPKAKSPGGKTSVAAKGKPTAKKAATAVKSAVKKVASKAKPVAKKAVAAVKAKVKPAAKPAAKPTVKKAATAVKNKVTAAKKTVAKKATSATKSKPAASKTKSKK